MPGHCEGSLVSVPNLLGRCCPGAPRKKGAGRKDGLVKSEREDRRSRPRARVLVRVATDSGFTHPHCLLTLAGYRLTAIRLNLFHHKRLNKEVHSSGPATVPRPSLASFRSRRLPLSGTVHHLRSSIWISFFSKAKSPKPCEIATSAIVRRIFSRYNYVTGRADKSSLIRRRTGVGAPDWKAQFERYTI